MSSTITKIAGLKPRDWIQCDGILEGTTNRGEVRSVDDAGGVAQWTDGTQGRFEWSDKGLRQIDPPQAMTGTLLEVPAEFAARQTGPEIREIPVDEICAFGLQPRSVFDEAELQSLADDILARGLDQEITVRPAHPSLGKPYELVCGERRWRAVKLAGLPTIRAKVRDVDNRTAVLIATGENLQRVQLNPIERSRNIAMLVQVEVSQDEIAKLFGCSVSSVSRTAGLLTLPGLVQSYLESGRLSQSHGEALLPLRKWPKELLDLARQCVEGEWSSNALEANARTLKQRMETKEQLPLDVPPPQRTTTRETTTETVRPPVPETASAPPAGASVPPPAELENAREAPEVAGEAEEPRAEGDALPPTTETKPNALKGAEELVADRAGTAVPTTIGAAVLDGPVTMCMVLQDCQAWIAAEGLTVKDFLARAKAAAYNRGLDAGSLLTSLEVS